MATSSETSKPVSVCRLYFNGKQCDAGQSCLHSHDENDFNALQARRKLPCRNWKMKGDCRFGSICQYRHDGAGSEASLPVDIKGSLLQGLKQRRNVFPLPRHTDSDAFIRIHELRELGSYNWLASDSPAIAVPGLPPILAIPDHDIKVEQDANSPGCKHSDKPQPYKYRFEPLVRSLQIMKPDYDIRQATIVTGLRNIRQIFDFCAKKIRLQDSFRIDLELINSTLFMARHPDSNVRDLGYGRGFERKCVCRHRCSLGDATSYHRIVSYDLGGCKLCIQYEADACKKEFFDGCSCNTDTIEHAEPEMVKSVFSERGIDADNEALYVTHHGIRLPSSCMVEIKSRTSGAASPFAHALPQLWLSGINHLVKGRHVEGHFRKDQITQENVSERLAKWMEKEQDLLRRFVGLLERLYERVNFQSKQSRERKFALIWHKSNPQQLDMYVREGGQVMLPAEMIDDIWDGRCT